MRRKRTYELLGAEVTVVPVTGVEALVCAETAGLYGESRLMDGGDTLLVDPEAGGLLDFLGLIFVPFELPFCCCCCCCRHLARRFLNQT